MAAYAATVTATMKHAARTGKFGYFVGEVNVTNYNAVRAAITGISGKFKSVLAVTFDASDNGHIFEWVDADSSIKAWTFDYDAVADGPAIEAADDTDAGSAHFIAFGMLS